MLRFLVCSLLLTLATSMLSNAQVPQVTPEKIAQIDAFVETRLATLGLPGAAIALIEDGQIVHARGFGVTQLGGEDVVTADTPFELGSVSKSFAATAILLLQEDGLLDVDDPVVKHLHNFRTDRAFRSDQITLRHLLTHRSGISTFDGNLTQARSDTAENAVAEAVKTLTSVRLQTEPGEAYAYSNANYLLLGAVIERVSDQSYEGFIQERILQALNMQNSWAGPKPDGRSTGAEPHRYWFGSVQHQNAKPTLVNVAYGGMRSSANDLANYLISFAVADRSILSAESLTQMTTSAAPEEMPAYGYGWFLAENEAFRLVYHTGANPGFSTIAGYSPDGGFGFVALANGQSSFTDENAQSLSAGVADLLFDRSAPPATNPLLIRVARAAVIALPFALLFWIGVVVVRWLRRGFRPLSDLTPTGIAGRVGLPSVFALALAYGLVAVLPRLNHAPMSAIHQFSPDMGFVLVASAVLAVIAAFGRLVLRVRPRV